VDQPRRHSSIIAMDGEGKIAAASVGAELYDLDPDWPALFRTNFARLAHEFDRLAARADFIVVDLGDTSRLAAISPQLNPDILGAARGRALLSADKFFNHLLRSGAGVRRTLILLTPVPPAEANSKRLGLAPIVAWGPGFRPGLLASPSTRTPGLVVNTDIAPTVLHLLGAEAPKEMVGRPIGSVPRSEDERFALLSWVHRHQAALDLVRQPAQHTLAWGMTVTLLLGAAAAYGLLGGWARRAVRGACLVWVSAGGGIVLGGLWAAESAASAVLSACLFMAALLVVAAVTGRPVRTLSAIAVAVMLLDAVSGQRLVRQSFLGYSASAGSRFYGLGNESAGFLLAMALASWSFWLEAAQGNRRRQFSAWILLAAACLVILLPVFGANLGMGAAAVLAVMAAEKGTSRKQALWPAAAGAVFVLAVAAAVGFDLIFGVHGVSHIGRSLHGGAEGLSYMVARKAVMNLILLRHSPWTLTALAGLAALLILRPRLQSKSASAAAGGLLAGAGAALVLNDSGIVAAGVILGMGACVILTEWARTAEQDFRSR
jgi:hypothetical protein